LQNLQQQQYQLEQQGRTLGEIRFDKRTAKAVENKTEEGTSYGSRLIASRIVSVADYINRLLNPERGRPSIIVKSLAGADLNAVAMVALSALIGTCSRTMKATAIAHKIGERVYYEVRRSALNKPARDHLKNALKGRRTSSNISSTLEYVAEQHQQTLPQWDTKRKIEVGRLLIGGVCAETGLFEIQHEHSSKGKHGAEVVIATPLLLDYIRQNREAVRSLSPFYLPMVVKPRRWSKYNVFNGCYLTDVQAPIPFIKRKHPRQMSRLTSSNPVHVFEAVNRVQETPLRIRRPVLNLLLKMVEQQIDHSLPLSSLPPAKDKPISEQYSWRVRQELEQANRETANLRAVVNSHLAIAEQFAQFERFYIPHHLDSRGRLYPVTPLNLQGADYIKGLLEFADGKPIGTEGIKWLKIHTANLFGIDKVPFEDRIQWVNDNIHALLSSAIDPLTCDFWTTADKPIQAFAACLELLGVAMEGERYISRIPIALDGSCSGLQHLGAAFRCEVTAKAVNLLPSDQPNDIYQDVANKVQASLESDNSELAKQWLAFCEGHITRKITKRSVMTFPYGSKATGFADQIKADILKPAMKNAPESVPFNDIHKAAQYLANHIYQAVSQTVLKAAAAMNWMQKIASAISSDEQVITWTTPLGFPVVQDYRVTKTRQIDSVVCGTRLRVRFNDETDKIDSRKMVNAIAPNVVHSLDSTHLLLTVLRAAEHQIFSYALIHDSFGTHAADTERFFQLIRETFVELYCEKVFEQLEQEFTQQINLAVAQRKKRPIPTLPSSGKYSLDQVLNSLFAFS